VRFVVARAEEFAPNSRRIVTLGGREIGVFRIGDRFYAVRNRCPHQGGPLCEGRTFPVIVADAPGEIELGERMLLICPWHGWSYDMATGEAHAPGDPRVKSYGVSVEPGRAVLQGSRPGTPSATTFVAETFNVSVEDEYVVLDA
jgi:nitrite reductase/ring-hydroxylating ferredoxin subunit